MIMFLPSVDEGLCFTVVHPSARLYVHLLCDIPVRNDGISKNLGTNIPHVSGHC